MGYRLVVADLDGTLRSRLRGVTPATQAAIAHARARGVRVCVATGRMWVSAAPWVRLTGADPPVILYNGGQVFDFAAGRILYDRRLPPAAARQALGLIRGEAGVQVHLFVGGRVYVERPDPLTDAYAADDGVTVDLVSTLDALVGSDDPPHKLLAIGPPDRVAALRRLIAESGVAVHAVRSEPQYLEILPAGVSKGAALGALCAAVGVPLAEVLAVGDNWNDLEMIEAAGLGVAMGHAPAGVRARANRVCGTVDEDGFRDTIERFVLDGPDAPAPLDSGEPRGIE